MVDPDSIYCLYWFYLSFNHSPLYNVVNPIINLSFVDDSYHIFMVILGMVYGIGFTNVVYYYYYYYQ